MTPTIIGFEFQSFGNAGIQVMGPGSSMQRERSLRASNACPRAAPKTTPLWTLFLIKLSISLSLSLSQ